MNKNDDNIKVCGKCANFTGAGDWNLCCTNPPAKSKECWAGWLCYKDTNAEDCENFTPAINKCNKCKYELECSNIRSQYKCFKYKRDPIDGGFYG